MHRFLKVLNQTVKLYNREIETAAKWVSSVTTYLLLKGKNIVRMSVTKLKDIVTESAKVCICGSNVLVVYLFYSDIFCFLIKSESSRNGSRVRPVPLPFIPLATPRGPELHPTPEVQLCGTTV